MSIKNQFVLLWIPKKNFKLDHFHYKIDLLITQLQSTTTTTKKYRTIIIIDLHCLILIKKKEDGRGRKFPRLENDIINVNIVAIKMCNAMATIVMGHQHYVDLDHRHRSVCDTLARIPPK